MKNLFLSIIFSLFYYLLTAQEQIKDFAHENIIFSFAPTFQKANSINSDTLGVSFPVGIGYQGTIGYQYKINQKWSIEAACGLGSYTLASSAILKKSKYDYLEKDFDLGKMNLDELYFTSNFGANYTHPIAKNYNLITQLKATATYFIDQAATSSFTSSSLDLLNGQPLYKIKFNSPEGWLFRPQIGFGIEKKLKKANALRLNIAYEHSFSNIISGVYEVRKSKSESLLNSYKSKGSTLKLELAYIISKKKELNEKGFTKKTLLKKGDLIFGWEAVKAKSHWNIYDAKDSIESNERFIFSGYNFQLDYMLTKNYSIGINFGRLDYYANIYFKNDPILNWTSSLASEAYRLGIINKYYLPLTKRLCTNTGLGIALNKTSKNASGGYNTPQEIDGRTFAIKAQTANNWSLSFDVSASLEFAINRSFQLHTKIGYSQGTTNLFSGNANYTFKGNTKINEAEIASKGSFLFMNFGTKIKLGNFSPVTSIKNTAHKKSIKEKNNSKQKT